MANLPPALLGAIEQEISSIPFPQLQTRVADMMSLYRSGEATAAPQLDETGAKAYAAYRMPATFAALKRVFEEVAWMATLAPRRIVDLGGGTGAGVWAAQDVWPSLQEAAVVDRSPSAIGVGRRLTSALEIAVTWIAAPISDDVPRGDVVVAAYLLGELPPPDIDRVVGSMLDAATTVIVVEPGTPAGYRRVLHVRDRMLEAGMTLAAPCPHPAPCPLAGDDWCHFAARFNRPPWLRRLKDAELGHEDEKYSYVAGTRLDVSDTADRVVRHPQKRSGMVTLELCRTDGTAEMVTVTRRHGERYRLARDIRWGDRWAPETR